MADAQALARGIGAQDALLFHRVSAHTWAHVGGVGRGTVWAGIVEADSRREPALRAATTGRLLRIAGNAASHVVGPYFASTAAVLAVDREQVVVWGSPHRSDALMAVGDAQLRAASMRLVDVVVEADPARRLSDELAVLNAVSALTRSLDLTLPAALERLARVTCEALQCSMVAAVMREDQYAVVQQGWKVQGPGAAVVAAVSQAVAAAGLQTAKPPAVAVAQRAAAAPLPWPLSPAEGVVSSLVVTLDVPGRGAMLAVYTEADARGFTTLDQRLVRQLAEAGSVVLQVAGARHELERQLSTTRADARRDALTGVTNRQAWNEALVAAQHWVEAGESIAVVLIDVDDLKTVNDARGHRAGDEVIIAAAKALQRCSRSGSDVVARLGGDEFGLLLVPAEEGSAEVVAERVRAQLRGDPLAGRMAVSASVGAATCGPGQQVADVVHDADTAMYRAKRAGKRARSVDADTDSPPALR